MERQKKTSEYAGQGNMSSSNMDIGDIDINSIMQSNIHETSFLNQRIIEEQKEMNDDETS